MIRPLPTLLMLAGVTAGGAVRAQPATMQPPPGGQFPGGQPPAMTADMQAAMHLAARNQLGVLEYCQASNAVGPDVVAMQRQQIAQLPPAPVAGLDQAEATGRQGIIQAGSQQVPLAQVAQSHGTTVAALCGQIAAMLRETGPQ
jgi:hypothetical protein